MRKRRVYLLMLILAVAGVGSALLAYMVATGEPHYGWRSLSSWTAQYLHPDSSQAHEEAADAIRHMGSNAFPYLLTAISYESPPWKIKLHDALSRVAELPDLQARRADECMNVFIQLGPQAAGAAAGLIRLMADPQHSEGAWRATYILGYLGRDGLPPLLAALTNQQARLRPLAATGIGSLGTNAGPALTALIQCLQDKDASVASAAACSLGRLKMDPSRVVPAMTGTLQHSNAAVRYWTVKALNGFGSEAHPAVPALLGLLKDPDGGVRNSASALLRRIDPEALERAGR